MTLIIRDHALEQHTLERVSRIANEPAYAQHVRDRLDAVERNGGPDGDGVTSADGAFSEARDEHIDAGAWTLVGLHHLKRSIAASQIDLATATEARCLVEEAMAHAAHAERLLRAAHGLLVGQSNVRT